MCSYIYGQVPDFTLNLKLAKKCLCSAVTSIFDTSGEDQCGQASPIGKVKEFWYQIVGLINLHFNRFREKKYNCMYIITLCYITIVVFVIIKYVYMQYFLQRSFFFSADIQLKSPSYFAVVKDTYIAIYLYQTVYVSIQARNRKTTFPCSSRGNHNVYTNNSGCLVFPFPENDSNSSPDKIKLIPFWKSLQTAYKECLFFPKSSLIFLAFL